jgi:hypothetical protein
MVVVKLTNYVSCDLSNFAKQLCRVSGRPLSKIPVVLSGVPMAVANYQKPQYHTEFGYH